MAIYVYWENKCLILFIIFKGGGVDGVVDKI